MSEIRFVPPSPDAPGFLKRLRKALDLRKRWASMSDPEFIDELIEFLLPYVVEPTDRAEASEALMEASAKQFMAMLEAAQGEVGESRPTQAKATATD